MKKVFYSLILFCGLSACSSEKVALEPLRIYDVANSNCKLSISPTDTRPDFYAENNAIPAKLSIELDKDGIAQCLLEDLKANCSVRKIYVNIANQDNQITLIVYHNVLEALADCICKYDVNFKMSKLTSGNYRLKVYYAKPNMKYEESDIVYNGQVDIVQDKKTIVTLSPEKVLSEV
ncbi:hypothetical protein [Alloprevotella sp. oral taxon 473]|jgi:hypothetical protein|uniref:hypothetical protein n=1 Tax=Alloprevotella sp. oral taxon 473 TaxID=712469 RepID=UPI0002A290D9|nr:hypothetical protein [Alloprevotella sp. oral taxon 473]EKX89565.1 hypothetical protein HMPREF9999_01516 [Alloprevotella sp. oral taxon 473 str. F0040]